MIKVAINGFGRIGRMVLRSIYENKFNKKIKVVAINNKASADISAFLLQKDSIHGDFKFKVKNNRDTLFINKDKIKKSSDHLPFGLNSKLIKFYDSFLETSDGNQMCFIYELMGFTLLDILKKYNNTEDLSDKIPLDLAKNIIKQIFLSLHELHEKNIIHISIF